MERRRLACNFYYAGGTPALHICGINMMHKGWYSRGYLPHFDNPTLVQMITFRQADALPSEKVKDWKQLLERKNDPELWAKIEEYLDAGYGSCVLRNERVARIVQDALNYFDDERYRLLAWVVMPNHVHVVIETFESFSLPKVVHSWKSFTAHEINNLLGRKGQLWQVEYFDRYIRSEQHLHFAVNYIHQNPVKAGLVSAAEEWPFSSACK